MADIGVLFFLTGLAVAVTVLHTCLQQAGRDEYAYLTLIVGLTIGLIKVLPMVTALFTQVQSVVNMY